MRRVCRRVNPLLWSVRTIKCVTAGILMMMAVIFVGVGLQPKVDARATDYPVLDIPAISLSTPVEPLALYEGQLVAPAAIAGAYSQSQNTTMLIGHSVTVFRDLWRTKVGDELTYAGQEYIVRSVTYLPKAEVDMNALLEARPVPTLVLMTCAGKPLGGQDYSERLIIIAERSK